MLSFTRSPATGKAPSEWQKQPKQPPESYFRHPPKTKKNFPKKKQGDLVEMGVTNMRYPKLEGLEKVTIVKAINNRLK